jgi:hypothetical protein
MWVLLPCHPHRCGPSVWRVNNDVHLVDTVAVDNLSRSFTDRQNIPIRAGNTVRGARGVSTGDAEVDGAVGAVADAGAATLAQLARVLARAGEWMKEEVAADLRVATTAAESLEAIRRRRPELGSGSPAPTG